MVPTAATLKPQETVQIQVKNGKAPFTFASANTATATVSTDGLVTGMAEGTTKISVKDATDTTITSLDYVVANASTSAPSECPLGDPAICQLLCGIMPELPFCTK